MKLSFRQEVHKKKKKHWGIDNPPFPVTGPPQDEGVWVGLPTILLCKINLENLNIQNNILDRIKKGNMKHSSKIWKSL